MLRVLFISHDATRTGAPILLLNLLRALKVQNRFDVEVLVKNNIGELLSDFQAIYPTKLIQEKQQPRALKSLLYRSRKKLKERRLIDYVKKFDAVISNTITNGDLNYVLRHHPNVFTYVHELEEAIKFFTSPGNVKHVLAHTNIFLYPSQAVKDNLIRQFGIAETNLQALPYLIPDRHNSESLHRSKTRAELAISDSEVIVVGIGTGDWRKGPDLFLQAILRAKTFNPKIRGVWVGIEKYGVDYSHIQYDVIKSKVADGFLLLEPLKNPFQFLAAADIFFLSSREDPYPLVVLEAAMMNLPLISFEDSGGANEFIDDQTGLKAPYYRTDIAAELICKLAASTTQRIDMGNNARNKYLQLHNEVVILEKLSNILSRK